MNNLFEAYTIQGFFGFCDERENIRLLKNDNKPRPWTNDEILNKKKFCNIDRNHDRGTLILYNKLNEVSHYGIVQVIGHIAYRLFSSSVKIINFLDSSSLDELLEKILMTKQLGIGSVPYQFFPCENGMTYHKFFKYHLYDNANEIFSYIDNMNNEDINDSIYKINSFFKFKRIFLFPTLQYVLDLLYISPNKVNINSNIHWGYASKESLSKISKNENMSIPELKSYLKENFKYNEIILEHALCEYNKYSKYVLGIRNINNKSNYKQRWNL